MKILFVIKICFIILQSTVNINKMHIKNASQYYLKNTNRTTNNHPNLMKTWIEIVSDPLNNFT